ncbi:MAG: ribose-5-phosphate isomerase [Candidatus Zambryskibacteria bacterium RIFCSPLOWO2_02_FULL_39_26]|uniref:Ribose-5-phosphate isomerase n=1 Tax=Candidatus Zambryskibacteria bacterium RIFCSPLOWO2_12_FULL_39_23 TaxID=1802776 RepID=A0A1G2UT00_9BACT|nr:MAG: ribose-5-phosphate isomerase [Candidatus Zambryskibacteria bacterium RIFCSPHIGHO2_12_FULL_39_47]OHB09509.1 MAG: ribose-5-phosphate isomerase [Candidatus Zambryskibacteria bacterium RIFCSPLOWO2_02_FULL_39_26]OHB12529.1 MAG: ribose-5-phosphate isomerase [Candidatus Zambryskibacteria bacterium RIFCSPLOWO2_12_FULL_39_23]
MKIYIGSDHAGFEMKKDLISYLLQNNHEIIDCGPKEYVHDDDYPDYVSIVADHISKEKNVIGIVIGRNGQGEAIVSNRFQNVRCAVFYGGSKHMITLSREHDDANMISLGSDFLTKDEAKRAVDLFLHVKFSGDERHVRRIKKIEQYS